MTDAVTPSVTSVRFVRDRGDFALRIGLLWPDGRSSDAVLSGRGFVGDVGTGDFLGFDGAFKLDSDRKHLFMIILGVARHLGRNSVPAAELVLLTEWEHMKAQPRFPLPVVRSITGWLSKQYATHWRVDDARHVLVDIGCDKLFGRRDVRFSFPRDCAVTFEEFDEPKALTVLTELFTFDPDAARDELGRMKSGLRVGPEKAESGAPTSSGAHPPENTEECDEDSGDSTPHAPSPDEREPDGSDATPGAPVDEVGSTEPPPRPQGPGTSADVSASAEVEKDSGRCDAPSSAEPLVDSASPYAPSEAPTRFHEQRGLAIAVAVILCLAAAAMPWFPSTDVGPVARSQSPIARPRMEVEVRAERSDVERIVKQDYEVEEMFRLVSLYETSAKTFAPLIPQHPACASTSTDLMTCAILREVQRRRTDAGRNLARDVGHLSAAIAMAARQHLDHWKDLQEVLNELAETEERVASSQDLELLVRLVMEVERKVFLGTRDAGGTADEVERDFRFLERLRVSKAHAEKPQTVVPAPVVPRLTYLSRALARLDWYDDTLVTLSAPVKVLSIWGTSPAERKNQCWRQCKGGLDCGNADCSSSRGKDRTSVCDRDAHVRYCGGIGKWLSLTAQECVEEFGTDLKLTRACMERTKALRGN